MVRDLVWRLANVLVAPYGARGRPINQAPCGAAQRPKNHLFAIQTQAGGAPQFKLRVWAGTGH
jgi:hypothetical protein